MSVPDLMLERYRLGELSRADADRLALQLANDETLRRRLEALERSDREFARDEWSARLAQGVKARVRQPMTEPRGAVSSLAIPAMIALTLMVALLLPLSRRDELDCCADRPKGASAALFVYRQTPSGSETLADNDLVRAGDIVRLGYRAAEGAFGAIVSIDGRGVVTCHLPPDAQRAVPLEAGKLVLLDRAFELDDAPKIERFYFVTAPSAFEVPAVIDAVRRAPAGIDGGVAQPLALPDRFTQVVFSLRKESRP